MSSRMIDGERRTLSSEKIEERLMVELNTKGEDGLNIIRDRAKIIAEEFGWTKAFTKLDRIISAILSSRPRDILTSPVAMARALGEPYDSGRMDLFQKLIGAFKK